jgi:hypothetical protein
VTPPPGDPALIFARWSGGIGASLLLPAMQSLTDGNFEGDARRRVYALGRPFHQRRPGLADRFLLEVVSIAILLSGIELTRFESGDCPLSDALATGPPRASALPTRPARATLISASTARSRGTASPLTPPLADAGSAPCDENLA